ncbi:hypothetical protein [Mesorhizobium sp. M4B.F.Ca.ET.058.02.1.1]|uniref:hypothetical protein n=1 Tax=Mesorhizobium sp. M4B.F.Ca.ET.058.02.1.1 TaxID=2493675 RepID=UPI000F74F89B|nr:hypothetical protein [Mesorhizobium sp. M4B.F.Ca.ET.058.02.1.1]AZO49913.1 hypothetical protein EJ073_20475 [Mesorhizobium sp. M4B.F.Ca.ET.058.02.1.1]
MIANTPVWSDTLTDLGIAFESHAKAFHGQRDYALGHVESGWLNTIRQRAIREEDASLLSLTSEMHGLLASPEAAGASFKDAFSNLYDKARRQAYPVCAQLIDEHHLHSGISRDYTLECIDIGQVRLIEDEGQSDGSMRTFAKEMLDGLTRKSGRPRHEAYRQVFDVYSEALVCRLLRERCGPALTISKIAETEEAGPDFACDLRYDHNGEEQRLEFFIEVKSLDIADAPQRLPEMLEDGMAVQIELERQVREGRRVAMAEGVIAPYRRYQDDTRYDPRSVRQCIETLIQKAAGNFKKAQFQRGPTFALANVLRLPLPGQGSGTLAPVYYCDRLGGACVSGALWHLAFGAVGTQIYRSPSFEGAGTDDGLLARAGLLVDPASALRAAGLIVFHHDQGLIASTGSMTPSGRTANGTGAISRSKTCFTLCAVTTMTAAMNSHINTHSIAAASQNRQNGREAVASDRDLGVALAGASQFTYIAD